MTELIAFAGAVNHLTNLAKSLFDTRDEIKLRELKLEFSDGLLKLHEKQLRIAQDYQAVLDSNESIKKQLSKYERWEQESSRYQLHQFAPGFMVYALKPEFASAQPAHWLCATCYHDRQTSILHPMTKGSNMWVCPRNPQHSLDAEETSTGYSG